eukprot:TRINITY_DN11895_c0_g1_i2.p1 TRINITY_DN11895_c0_g1~~TRINITY_DN11895_c0_g1_i2.p1  ORF type:complete len:423 (+),score=34.93 TRINITY_DN11895_c0_g1_i2:311-1579(+)
MSHDAAAAEQTQHCAVAGQLNDTKPHPSAASSTAGVSQSGPENDTQPTPQSNHTQGKPPPKSKNDYSGSKLPSTTNFYLFLSSATPMLPVQHSEQHGAHFQLRDVWRFFDAPYGFPVPMVLEGEDREVYYNPFLSAIQIYVPSEEDSPKLAFEFYETETPFQRPPLVDRLNELAGSDEAVTELLINSSSADISPCSWFAISWYPIVCGLQAHSRPLMQGAILTYHALTIAGPSISESDLDPSTAVGCSGEGTPPSASGRILPLSEVDQADTTGHWGHDGLLQLPSLHDIKGSKLTFLEERADCPVETGAHCWTVNPHPKVQAEDFDRSWRGNLVPLPLIGYLPYKLHAAVWYAHRGSVSGNSKKCVPPYFLGRAATHMLNSMKVVHADKIHVDQYTGGANNLFECVCEACKSYARRDALGGR